MTEMRVDVLVTGAGPAGARAAWAAAKAGAEVLLIEKKPRLGSLPHCAEFLPRPLALEVDFPPRSRVQAVEGMETRLGGRTAFLAGPGWIADRAVFDHGLGLAAAGAGALIWAGATLSGRENGRWVVKRGGERVEVVAGAVVAADGALSPTARLAGWARQPVLAGYQWQVPLAAPKSRTLVFLDPAFRDGYAWLFPREDAANLGVGCRAGAKPPRVLEALCRELIREGIIGRGILAVSGGAIPLGGLREEVVREGVILAGDAAGLTHPITGAGVPQAVYSGALAGEAAVKLAGGGDGAGEWYAGELVGRYGRSLGKALELRREMERGWEGEGFVEMMAGVWPGWKEG